MLGLLQPSPCLVTHGGFPTAQNLHQLCFSLSLCSLSMCTTLWPLNSPFFFSRSAVELIAKWAVCKHTGHTTYARVSIHRRGPLEGNQNTTENITKKIKCQQAATYIQDPPAKCSPCHCFWKASSQARSHRLAALSHVLQSMMLTCSSLFYQLPPWWPFPFLC